MASEPPSSGDPPVLRYAVDAATAAAIGVHLRRCDESFVPPLGQRLAIDDYAAKIRVNAVTFEAWSGGDLVGLVAAYLNQPEREQGFVTSVSVAAPFQGVGIASTLMQNCIRFAEEHGFRRIGLEVHASSRRAIALYRRRGFEVSGSNGEFLRMTLEIERAGAT
jgi:ribosomal protein S18 acetylase RimI-like enzyme